MSTSTESKNKSRKSLLLSILDEIQKEVDPLKVKKLCISRIQNSKIDPLYQVKMIAELKKVKLHKVIQLVYNWILKYEGKGVLFSKSY